MLWIKEVQVLSIDILRKYFEYHYALYERVWDSIEEINDEQYFRVVEYSRGSLHDQMFHVAVTDRAWLRGIQGIPRKPRLKIDDFPDQTHLRILFDEVKVEVFKYLDTLTESELERVPRRFRGPVWQVLLHVVNHGTDHRAQILRILHDFGAQTFDQDFVLWLWRN
jgi:uncharacterized damage-inducible protein DinB